MFIICIYVYMGVNTPERAGACGVKRVLDPLGLEVQVVVSHLLSVLGAKRQPLSFSPALLLDFLKFPPSLLFSWDSFCTYLALRLL